MDKKIFKVPIIVNFEADAYICARTLEDALEIASYDRIDEWYCEVRKRSQVVDKRLLNRNKG